MGEAGQSRQYARRLKNFYLQDGQDLQDKTKKTPGTINPVNPAHPVNFVFDVTR
jgi:hypothetical protein